jgi:hypothetical protein
MWGGRITAQLLIRLRLSYFHSVALCTIPRECGADRIKSGLAFCCCTELHIHLRGTRFFIRICCLTGVTQPGKEFDRAIRRGVQFEMQSLVNCFEHLLKRVCSGSRVGGSAGLVEKITTLVCCIRTALCVLPENSLFNLCLNYLNDRGREALNRLYRSKVCACSFFELFC